MKISVALCTCNGAAHLWEQLESILQQNLPPFEIVLSDDASTDDTVAIAEAFAHRAPFPIHLLRNKERLGSTRNFEQAMRACSGEAIALCDQDDIWYPQKLSVLAEMLQDPAIGAVFSDGDLLQQDILIKGSLWRSFGLTGQELKEFSIGDPVAVMLRGNKVTGMTLILRHQMLEQVLPIPPLWTHDYWLAWMLILYTRLAPCPQHLVAYRTHGQQQVGLPLRFIPAVRQRGLRNVFAEFAQIARQDSARLVTQIGELLNRLELDQSSPAVAAAILRLRRYVDFQSMRSQIQFQDLRSRICMVTANWSEYPVCSMQPGKDRLIDLLGGGPLNS